MNRTQTFLPLALLALLGVTASLRGQEQIVVLKGTQDNEAFGVRLRAGSDLDGDGVGDFLVSSLYWDSATAEGAGKVTIYSGANLLEIDSLEGEARADGFGFASFATDYTGDGIVEILIAAGGADTHGNDAGRLYLFDGATRALLQTWDGTVSGEGIGVNSLAPDWDGDGVLDIACASPTHLDFAPPYNIGMLYIYSGKDHSTLYSRQGAHQGALFGTRIEHLGDVDGDGVDELLIASIGEDSRGVVYVISGSTHQDLYRKRGSQDFANYGENIAAVGDIDQDGCPDFAVTETATNTVFVYSGKDGTRVWKATESDMRFMPVTAVGDANEDGWIDLLVGAFNKEGGAAYLLSGRTGTRLFRFDVLDLQRQGVFGCSVAGLGDINGDGIADLAIGDTTYEESPGLNPGGVYLFAGNDLYLQADRRHVKVGETLDVHTRGGDDSALSFLAVVELDGAPYFQPLDFGRLDTKGNRTLTFTVPASATGHTIGVTSYSEHLHRPGAPRSSSIERITVE